MSLFLLLNSYRILLHRGWNTVYHFATAYLGPCCLISAIIALFQLSLSYPDCSRLIKTAITSLLVAIGISASIVTILMILPGERL